MPTIDEIYWESRYQKGETGWDMGMASLLFKFPLTQEGPPFGGSEEEYKNYFEPYLEINTMEEAYTSIAPRKDKELFLILKKRSS